MIVGIGIDLVEVARIQESLDRFGDRFQRRIFTQVERDYCNALPQPALHLAARFAAKEAFVKAIGTGMSRGVSWKEIGIENLLTGQPVLRVEGVALEHATALSATRMHVSLTHTATHAAAVVVLETE